MKFNLGKKEPAAPQTGSPAPLLIVGLGNPGPEYEKTRHNAGFMVLDELAKELYLSFTVQRKLQAHLATAPGIVLMKPRSFMNLSGGPISQVARFYRVPASQIIVVHDELDLPFGTTKIKQGGGENGHNGLKSTSNSLSTKDYFRLKFGIGRPPGRMNPADFVLKPFTKAEQELLPILTSRCAEGLELLIKQTAASTEAPADAVAQGIAAAQNFLHQLPASLQRDLQPFQNNR